LFVGVDPSVLGATPVSRHGPPVLFSPTVSQLLLRKSGADEIWTLDACVPGYDRTGHTWSYFNEFVKVKGVVQSIDRPRYSLYTGCDLRGQDISWTEYVPGDYMVSDSSVILFDDHHSSRKFTLVRPYIIHGGFKDNDLYLQNIFVDSFHPTLRNALKNRSGVYYMSFDGNCRWDNGRSLCRHDHCFFDGSTLTLILNDRLTEVMISEFGYQYPYRAFDCLHQSLADEYAVRGKKVISRGKKFEVIPGD
jgi:hypothetical protein